MVHEKVLGAILASPSPSTRSGPSSSTAATSTSTIDWPLPSGSRHASAPATSRRQHTFGVASRWWRHRVHPSEPGRLVQSPGGAERDRSAAWARLASVAATSVPGRCRRRDAERASSDPHPSGPMVDPLLDDPAPAISFGELVAPVGNGHRSRTDGDLEDLGGLALDHSRRGLPSAHAVTVLPDEHRPGCWTGCPLLPFPAGVLGESSPMLGRSDTRSHSTCARAGMSRVSLMA